MIFIASVTLIAFVLRLIAANQSLWLDEAASVELARLPLAQLWPALGGDFHPPLFYLLLKAWLPLAAGKEWLLRLPNIVLGTLSVPLLYLLLKAAFASKLNFKISIPRTKFRLAAPEIAALLLALNPLAIYYSQELRMYTLNLFLTLLSWLFLLHYLRAKKDGELLPLVGYTLVSLANLYTFYGAFFNLLAQLVFVFLFHKNQLKRFLLTNLLLTLGFLPWLSTLQQQLVGGDFLTRALPGWSQLSGNLSLKSLSLIFVKFSLGRISFANKLLYGALSTGVLLYFGLLAFLGSHQQKAKAFLVWFFVPLALALVFSLQTPILGYWRYLYILPALLTLIALGLAQLPPLSQKLNLFVIISLWLLSSLYFLATPSLQREDWRGAARLLESRPRTQTLTIVNFPAPFAPLKFYAPNLSYYPSQLNLGSVRSDLDESLTSAVGSVSTIYVLDYLSDLTDPSRQVNTWLSQAGFVQRKIHDITGVGLIYEFSSP